MMKLTRFKLALLLYVAFDFLIGGHCGGLLPLGEVMAAQSGPPAIGNITSAGSTCSTTSTPTNCVILQLDAASGAATIEITGTFVGTGQFEAFSGSAWTNINCTPPNSTTAASSATAAGAWQCNVAGYSAIRVRASAYVSGTLVVIINSAHASAKSGGGSVFASGGTTANLIPKENGSGALIDSLLSDSGTALTYNAKAVPSFTTGGATTNTIPKTSGTGGLLADSSITDNGTTVISTEPVQSSAGTSGAATGIQVGAVNHGLWKSGNALVLTAVGTDRAVLDGTVLGLRNDTRLIWSNNTNPDATTDAGISRLAAGYLGVGSGAASSTAGFIKSGGTLEVTASNYTTSATTLATAGVITGLSFTTPASLASNWSFRCDIVYSQATAAAANLWGITTSGTAPTSMLAGGEIYTSLAGANTDGSAVITSATSTTVVTATPSAAGAIGTTADMFMAHIWGTVEAPSNASPTIFGIAAASGNASDALTIYRGSACWVY